MNADLNPDLCNRDRCNPDLGRELPASELSRRAEGAATP
jgi:hypothetical protein